VARPITPSVLRKRGLRILLSCNEACSATATLTVKRASPKPSLKRRVAVAQGSLSVGAAGSRRMTLALTGAGRRALRDIRSARFHLKVVVTDRAGNRDVIWATVALRH
jgi:hypothetical protein